MLSAVSELLVTLGAALAVYVVALLVVRLGAALLRRERPPSG
jgi:hypothetical protein